MMLKCESREIFAGNDSKHAICIQFSMYIQVCMIKNIKNMIFYKKNIAEPEKMLYNGSHSKETRRPVNRRTFPEH